MADDKPTADDRARQAKARDQAARNPTIESLGETPGMPGWTSYLIGGRGGVMIVQPTLLPKAPASLRRRYRDRLLANATGRCPRCGEVVGEPTSGRDRIGSQGLAHEDGCTVLFRAQDLRWIDPRSGVRP